MHKIMIKKIFKDLLAILLLAQIVNGEDDEANYVRSTIVFDVGKPPTISTDYYNGFGELVQVHKKCNLQPNKAVIGAYYYNSLGKDTISIKPFIGDISNGFINMEDFALVYASNSYYDGSPYIQDSDWLKPDAEGYAFIEKEFYPNTLGEQMEIGRPGKVFSLYTDENTPHIPENDGHHVKIWTFSVSPNQNLNINEHGFIIPDKLNEEDLDDVYGLLNIKQCVDTILDSENDLPIMPDEGFRCIISLEDKLYKFNGSGWNTINVLEGSMCWVKSLKELYIFNGMEWEIKNSKYRLSVIKEPDGRYKQTLTDKFGNPIKEIGNTEKEGTPNEIYSENRYDIFGNKISKIPPNLNDDESSPEDYKTNYKYNSAGFVYEKENPDYGKIELNYDISGRERFLRTAYHRALEQVDGKNHYLVYEYDSNSRIINVFEYVGSHSFDEPDYNFSTEEKYIKLANIYDEISSGTLDNIVSDKKADLFNNVIVNNIKRRRGRIIAAVAYNSKNRNVVDLYSYNDKGRIFQKYKLIPGVDVQMIEYEYNIRGIVTKKRYYNGYNGNEWNLVSEKIFNYDEEHRLKNMGYKNDSEEKKLIEYDYAENNMLLQKSFMKIDNNNDALERIAYHYTVRNWIEKIETKEDPSIFSEEIFYEKIPISGFVPNDEYANKYNGSISGISFKGLKSDRTLYNYNLSYFYDGINRLIETKQDIPEQGMTREFDEHFEYDNMGRISEKEEGTTSLINYVYADNSNRLRYIEGTQSKPSPKPMADGRDNYLYDPNGRTVVDRSKKMVVKYNWRDMPILFKFYNAIPLDDESNPPEELEWNDVDNIEGRIINIDGQDIVVKIIAQVECVYDSFNQRVQKYSYITED